MSIPVVANRRLQDRSGWPGFGKGIMKLLLTSAGIKNASIHGALLDLLGRPIADCNALCVPTTTGGLDEPAPRYFLGCSCCARRRTLRPDFRN
jgi:hypothetical protein